MMRCRNSLFLVVVAMVGVTLLNSILYHPHLVSTVQQRRSPGSNLVFLNGSSQAMNAVGTSELHLPDMGTDKSSPCNDLIARKIIQAALDGPLLCPDSKAYDEAAMVFNSALKISPGAVIRPTHEGDVLVAMQVAAKYDLVVTVKGGGHNPAGFALNEGGLVIDMKYMDKIWKEDASGSLIRAQGGANWGETYKLMREIRRSVVGGGCPTVGVAGLALGGGVGWLSRSRGLVSDNMMEVKIAFPNATMGVIDAQGYPDLLWALRGAGGSNFGVVTEVLLKTHPAEDKYFAGNFCFERNLGNFRDVLELHRDMINGKVKVDDRLTMDLFMSRIPPKTKHVKQSDVVRLCWAGFYDGSIQKALYTTKELLRRLADLLSEREACLFTKLPCKKQSEISFATKRARETIRSGRPWLQGHTFASWAGMFGTDYLDVHWKSTVAERYTEQMIDTTIKHFSNVAVAFKDYGAKMTIQVAFEHLGGAMRRNGNSVSAWKHGNARIMASIQSYISHPYSFWERGSNNHDYVLKYLKNWTDSYYGAMSPSAQGCYGNYADAELSNWEDLYYGPEIYGRLKKIKASVPGVGVFRSAQRIHVEEGPQEVVLPKFEQALRESQGTKSMIGQVLGLFKKSPSNSAVDPPHTATTTGKLVQEIENRRDHEDSLTETEASTTGSKGDFQITNPALLNASSVKLVYEGSIRCPHDLVSSMVPILPTHVSHVDRTAGHVGFQLDFSSKDQGRTLLGSTNQSTNAGKTIFLTGGSRGLGWSAALHFAKLGANVLYTSRSEASCHLSAEKMKAVRETLKLSGKTACVPLVLDDFTSIQSFSGQLRTSEEFRAWGGSLDVVVFNAGVLSKFGVASEAGNVSDSLAINHMGHFLLMHELLQGNLVNPEHGKVVVVSSHALEFPSERDVENALEVPAIPYQDTDPNTAFMKSGTFLAYASAKKINFLFAKELSRRLMSAGSAIAVGVAIPPGTALTHLTSDFLASNKYRDEVLKGRKLMSTAEGALAMVFLALDGFTDDRFWVPGKISVVSGCKVADFPELAQSEGLQCHVWDASLQIAGLMSSSAAGHNSVVDAFLAPCR
ncbi:hypothetical protein BSKO_06489 [Bryopsis sp. KO-2023]|nr:hypothetical protein BSKO_06489 [Bryopsis sp. KO-2023]